jgi:hypothetical protein
MRHVAHFLFTALLLAIAGGSSASEFTVGVGATVDLGTGSLDLGCADLDVGGTLSAGTTGFSQARDVSVGMAGVLNGNSGVLEVAGDWDNSGTFNAGTSTVRMVDGCGLASAVVAGNTTFANLEMTTSGGFLYQIESDSTQTVTGSLSLIGALGNLLTIRSTAGGNQARFDAQGNAIASFVDVQDNHALPMRIALDGSSVKGSNTSGWYFAAAVPAVGVLGLAVLAMWILATAGRLPCSKRSR